MRELTVDEMQLVFGGSRTGPNPSTTDPSEIAAITAILQEAFDNNGKIGDFTREDWAALNPEDPSDWPALEALYDQVLEELGGID